MLMFIIFFTTFSLRGYHSHFIQIWYMIRVPLSGTLFAIANFHTLHHTKTIHLTCVFPSLVNNIYIVGHVSNVVLTFLCLQAKFSTLGFSIQLTKYVTWSPHELNLPISLSFSLLTPNTCFHILNTTMGSIPFVQSFIIEVF
jgi:hypothetical protein